MEISTKKTELLLWTPPEALQVRFLGSNVVDGYIAGRFELLQLSQLHLSSEIEHFFGGSCSKTRKILKTRENI